MASVINKAEIIAVDAGGTWIKAGRFNQKLEVLDKVKIESGAAIGVEEYFDSIAKSISSLTTAGEEKNVSIGLALPGLLSKDRKILRHCGNIKGLQKGDPEVNIQDALARRLSIHDAVAENDAGCAALAEWQLGHGQANSNTYLLHITWGTGIGTGLIINSVNQYGWEGGHLPITWASGLVTSAKKEIFSDVEDHIGAPAIVKTAQNLLANGELETALTPTDFADPRQTPIKISQLSRVGDALCEKVLSDAMFILARSLHIMAVLGYPDMVTIGGAMMDSDWLLDKLRAHVSNLGQGFLATLQPDMIHRALLGNDAGMIGAAILAQQKLP